MKIDVGGQIQGISLSSFLQIVQMDKTSCTLKIYTNDDLGYLWITDGTLVAAEAGPLQGLNAAYEVIGWHNTVIVIDNVPPPYQNITTPLISILMEGLRIRDEKASMELDEEDEDQNKVDNKESTPPLPGEAAASLPLTGEEIPELSMEEEESPLPPLPLRPAPPSRPLHPAVAMDMEEESEHPVDDEGPWIYEYEDEDMEEEPNPIRTILITSLLFLLITGASFGGYIGYRAHTLKSEFHSLLTDLTAMGRFTRQKRILEAYLDGHLPNRFTHQITEHLNEANALLEIDQHIQAMPRNRTFIGTSLGLFRGHLKNHPHTPFMTAIHATMKRLPAQLDELDYRHLRESEGAPIQVRLGIYRSYLSDHPQGIYTREVKSLQASLSDEFYMALQSQLSACETAESWAPCIALADTFTAEFSEDSRFHEIWLLRDGMVDRTHLLEMRRRAMDLTYDEAGAMYLAYLQETPQSTTEMDIKKEITALGEKAEQEKRWQTARTLADNPQETIGNRIQEVDLYVERYPEGPFTPEALEKRDALKKLRTSRIEEKRASHEREVARHTETRRLEIQRQSLYDQRQAEAEARRTQAIVTQRQALERHIQAQLSKAPDRFTYHNDGTVTDSQSGLTWMVLDSKNRQIACMNFKAAKIWVEDLSIEERSNWRLPTPNELALLYNGTPHYPPSGAPWYWTSERESGPWGSHTSALTFDPNNKRSFIQKARPVSECGYVHAVHAP